MLFSLLFIFSLSQSAYTWGVGLQGRSPPAMSALRVYIKNQSKRCIACSAMKVKTMF